MKAHKVEAWLLTYLTCGYFEICITIEESVGPNIERKAEICSACYTINRRSRSTAFRKRTVGASMMLSSSPRHSLQKDNGCDNNNMPDI